MLLIAVGALLAAFVLVIAAVRTSRPPTEAGLIRNFYEHRSDYERLRDMLVADPEVVRVADWGVETVHSGIVHPPQGGFPSDRYREYLARLQEMGAKWAFRDRGASPDEVGVGMWASGFAGDTRHIEICWLKQEPTNQVSSLDAFYKMPKPRKPVFRHIDSDWYLWADW